MDRVGAGGVGAPAARLDGGARRRAAESSPAYRELMIPVMVLSAVWPGSKRVRRGVDAAEGKLGGESGEAGLW